MLDNASKRRAFHLANLSAKLALISERLADQATALADAALELTDEINQDTQERSRRKAVESTLPPRRELS